MDLSERQKKILRAIVESYVASAEPVGSKAIAEGLGVSSATIRNEMSALSELGLLEQPHTSAGRVPSPKGYRLYVNELMEEHRLSLQETQKLNEALHLKMRELDQVIDQAGKLLSQLTQYPAFALAESQKRITLKRFDLLSMGADGYLVVVLTDTKVARNRLLRFSDQWSEEVVAQAGDLLNRHFIGLSSQEVTPALMSLASSTTADVYAILSQATGFAVEVLEELEQKTVHTAGITNILNHPEYQSLDRAGPLMSYLSEAPDKQRFPVPNQTGMEILIGPENVSDALKDSSVVMTSYDIGDGMKGVIGVVGPTRMDYAKVTARLSYFAEGLSRLFGKGELPPTNPEDET